MKSKSRFVNNFFVLSFFCCLIFIVYRNCSTRQLDLSGKSPSITTQTAAQKILRLLPSKGKETGPRPFNNTMTDSSMAVSIVSPLTRHLLHVAIGISVQPSCCSRTVGSLCPSNCRNLMRYFLRFTTFSRLLGEDLWLSCASLTSAA
jgi:hypothetical protein